MAFLLGPSARSVVTDLGMYEEKANTAVRTWVHVDARSRSSIEVYTEYTSTSHHLTFP